jgi:biopolymer transport protein ExbD
VSASVGKRGRKIPYRSDKGPQSSAPTSDINVTPLVDVCLVLLIIFMVVTPMLGRGRDVRLPVLIDAEAHKEGDQVFVSVDDEGAWIEQDMFQERSTFITRLSEDLKVAQGKASANGYSGPLLFIKGDSDTDYGRVRTVMQWINESELGLQNIALVVDIAEQAGGGE